MDCSNTKTMLLLAARLWCSLCLVAAAWLHVASADQAFVDYVAEELIVDYEVITNFRENEAGSPRTDFSISLTNGGDTDVTAMEWQIWLCSVRMLEPDQLYNDPDTVADLGGGVEVEHFDGCLYTITFTQGFQGIPAGETVTIEMQSSDWTSSRTDIMPNWYVTSEGTEPRTLVSTGGESLDFVSDFTSPEQWKRRTYDEYNPFTAEERYATVSDVEDLGRPGRRIMPTPLDYRIISSETMNIRTGDWVVVASIPPTITAARYLADKLGAEVVGPGQIPGSRYFYLSIGEIEGLDGEPVDVPEANKLTMSVAGQLIYLTGKDAPGLMHCVQSLLSLEDGQGNVPDASVLDYPRYHYRGMHVDVGRNFVSKESILTLLESMSMYKLNKFHFHLTDDEGWRLEIPGLPELTEVGSVRCHDVDERTCIVSQLGSGPGSDNAGSGFYSVEEYREILQYAQDRHIEVIPEFDMPGHGHAAIRSMEARYESLKDSDMAAATEFLLSDPDDTSLYVSIQYFRHNAINPCIDSSYAFVDKVIQEVKAMHQGIQPLRVFHFGGDEVPHGAMERSPACEAYLGHPVTPEDASMLKTEFVVRVGQLVSEAGLDFGGWEDGLMTHANEPYERADFASENVYGMPWNNIWEWGGGSRAYILANNDYNVVLAHATDLYFDMPYEPDPEERGFYWATRFTSSRNTFNYMPERVYDNMEVDLFGRPLVQEEVCASVGCVPLQPGQERFIEGIQGQLWSETVRTSDQFDFMVFPRLLAVAERGWHTAAWESEEDDAERERLRDEDWGVFANTLGYKELSRLDQLNVQYRVPLPGARFEGYVLEAATQFPGLPIEYSDDDGETWTDYMGPTTVAPDTLLLLRTRSADGNRVSRTVQITSPSA